MARAAQFRRRPQRNIFGWSKKERTAKRKRVSGGATEARGAGYRYATHKSDENFSEWMDRKDFGDEKYSIKQRLADAFAMGFDRGKREIEAKEAKADRKIEKAKLKKERADRKRADAEDRKIEREMREKGLRNSQRRGCANTRKGNVSDRAKRYRANQPGCRPNGAKQCKLCGAKRDLMVDHKDGNESNGQKSNLRWLCRSCNNTIAAEMAKSGQGRRTVQYNPQGAQTLGEYINAVLQHTRGAHDEGGRIIHATPKWKRQEYASQIWSARHAGGTASIKSSRLMEHKFSNPAWGYGIYQGRGFDARQVAHFHSKAAAEAYARSVGLTGYSIKRAFEKDQNPAASPEQYRLAQAVLSGTARDTHMSREAAREIVDRTPARLRSEYSRRNPDESSDARLTSPEYQLGYGLGQRDKETASLPKTWAELEATFNAKFDPSRANPLWFFEAYKAGYGPTAELAAADNPRGQLFLDGNLHLFENKPGADGQLSGPSRYVGRGTPVEILQRGRSGRVLIKADYYGTPYYGWADKDRLTRESQNPEPGDDRDSEEYAQAKRIASLFHGRPVQEEMDFTEGIREHDWLWRVGPLVSLKIKVITKRKPLTFPFHQDAENMVHLMCSPDGRQLYLRGGDQELDLEAIGMGPDTAWFRDSIVIGELTHFTYRDKKKFHQFKATDYYHKVGSALDHTTNRHYQATKAKPIVIYDSLAKKIQLAGGQGEVDTENLIDGTSPGIVK